MNTVEYFKQRFDQLEAESGKNGFSALRKNAFSAFSRFGLPTARHEEWKYTRIGGLFNKEYKLTAKPADRAVPNWEAIRLPGHEQANSLVFINGRFSFSNSHIRSSNLVVLDLEKASKGEYKQIISDHLGHSNRYLKDGVHSLNTAFLHGGVFIHVQSGQLAEHPVYIYNITDAREENILSQPRSLIHIGENARIQLVETYFTVGSSESFTNQVMEVVIEKAAIVEYYKIQNDISTASQVSTTHFRLVGKSYLHTVTISINGAILRNNLNVVLDAERCEAHMYGLYFPEGKTHVDNHTIVDNVKPNCFSNELYKGIINDEATAVFNGKIFVRPNAQKTNAYQSNKNILLSDNGTVNTKPQLEIFADDVKCSHGCTVGQLDEEGLFYLRSRGISEKMARALLVRSFATDILEHVKPAPIRTYIEQLISKKLEHGA